MCTDIPINAWFWPTLLIILQFTGNNHETQRVTSKPGPHVTRITGTPFLDNNLVNVVSAGKWVLWGWVGLNGYNDY